jgi:hypothetical protein
MPEPDVALDLQTIDENNAIDDIDIALMPMGEFDESRVVASSRRPKELARSQLDEEGENSSLFGDMCDKLFWKYREYGYGVLDNVTVPIPSYVPLGTLGTPMDEQDRGILERVRNRKNQDAWIRGRYRRFIHDRRWTQHKAAREEVIRAWYDLVVCNFSFLKVIGGLSEYIDDARVENAVRDIQFESARERARYVDKSR